MARIDLTPATGSVLRGRDLRSAPLLLAISFFCFALTFLGMAGLLLAYFIEVRGFSIERATSLIAPTTACGALRQSRGGLADAARRVVLDAVRDSG